MKVTREQMIEAYEGYAEAAEKNGWPVGAAIFRARIRDLQNGADVDFGEESKDITLTAEVDHSGGKYYRDDKVYYVWRWIMSPIGLYGATICVIVDGEPWRKASRMDFQTEEEAVSWLEQELSKL